MKRSIQALLLGLLLALPFFGNGQCVPNPPSNVAGFYPNPVPEACQNQPYNQVVQFVFPLDTIVSVPPFGTFTIPFDSFRVDNILNIPAGINFVMSSANGKYYPVSSTVPARGCADVGGTPTATTTYQDSIVIVVTAWATAPFLGVQQGQDTLRINLKINPQPQPSYTFSTNALQANFTNTTTGNYTYGWDFGDGNTSTQTSPSHTYAAPGNYSVCLTATDTGGCVGQSCQVVTVGCAAPSSAFSSANAGLDVTFTDNTLGTVTGYFWDFGDGNFSTQQNPMNSYAFPGSYTVCLTTTNVCGSDSACATVTVCDVMTAGFSNSANLLQVDFADLTTGLPTAWSWDFGDGNTSTQQNPSHTYSAAGTYVVCLTATDACTSTVTCDTITVIAVGLENSLVNAIKAWPNPAQQQLNVTFPANVEGIALKLYDLAGKELRSIQLEVGQTFAQMDLKGLANGSYFLQASTPSAQKTLKIQVMQ